MSKRPFVISGILVLALAVLIPFLAFRARGDQNTGDRKVPADLQQGKQLFDINCGTCHTLHAAGTDGNFAPNLDLLLAPQGPATSASTIAATRLRVLNALKNGVDTATTPGRMPAGILNGQQAQQVASFVAHEAGK